MLYWLQAVELAHFLDVPLNAGALLRGELVHRSGKDALFREICDFGDGVVVQLLVSGFVLAVLVGWADQLVVELLNVVEELSHLCLAQLVFGELLAARTILVVLPHIGCQQIARDSLETWVVLLLLRCFIELEAEAPAAVGDFDNSAIGSLLFSLTTGDRNPPPHLKRLLSAFLFRVFELE